MGGVSRINLLCSKVSSSPPTCMRRGPLGSLETFVSMAFCTRLPHPPPPTCAFKFERRGGCRRLSSPNPSLLGALCSLPWASFWAASLLSLSLSPSTLLSSFPSWDQCRREKPGGQRRTEKKKSDREAELGVEECRGQFFPPRNHVLLLH